MRHAHGPLEPPAHQVFRRDVMYRRRALLVPSVSVTRFTFNEGASYKIENNDGWKIASKPGAMFGPAPTIRVISGGQTGADRGGLLAAMDLHIEVGGWCPKGRRAEDTLPPEFHFLKETPLSTYEQRTEWNVRDADVTLILHTGQLGPGSKLTISFCRRLNKPYAVIDVKTHAVDEVNFDKLPAKVRVLNIAGPRESRSPGLQETVRGFVRDLLTGLY